jgi:hypothetical protein
MQIVSVALLKRIKPNLKSVHGCLWEVAEIPGGFGRTAALSEIARLTAQTRISQRRATQG